MLTVNKWSSYQRKQQELQAEMDDTLKAGRILYVQDADGKWAYVGMPRECPHCSGSGISLDEELQLEGLCPECGGTGEC